MNYTVLVHCKPHQTRCFKQVSQIMCSVNRQMSKYYTFSVIAKSYDKYKYHRIRLFNAILQIFFLAFMKTIIFSFVQCTKKCETKLARHLKKNNSVFDTIPIHVICKNNLPFQQSSVLKFIVFTSGVDLSP